MVEKTVSIIDIKALRGPNYYNQKPVIYLKIDIRELEENLNTLLPEFQKHFLSYSIKTHTHKESSNNFNFLFEDSLSDSWPAEIIKTLSLYLLFEIGHEIYFGKIYSNKEKGIYTIVFSYWDEKTGITATKYAVDIVNKYFSKKKVDLKFYLKELKRLADAELLDFSTQAIINQARKRGIPHIKLNDNNYIQLGYGIHQRRFENTVMDNTSNIGVEIASNKTRTKDILIDSGINVPHGFQTRTFDDLKTKVKNMNYPLVIKPLDGNQGRGITLKISQESQLFDAFEKAQKISPTVIVEKYFEGHDYRMLVIDGKFAAAAQREPAFIVGDGQHTIQELIDYLNQDPNRGQSHEKTLTQITIDTVTMSLLSQENLDLNSIIEKNKKLYLKSVANLSAGASAKDVTDLVHPFNKALAERISRIIDLNVMGLDIIAPSLEKPLEASDYAVIEVNAGPGFRMHLKPSSGKPRNVAAMVVDMLYPPGTNHSIPIVAITGTNGKTTTSRLIQHILTKSGHVVGLASTDNVSINHVPILLGDCSEFIGAHHVLKDSSVEYAILETARGGILKRGLGFESCDVGIFLNLSSDHLGEGGIESLNDLARLKSVVTESVKPEGYAIFNADDAYVMCCIPKTKANIILFSMDYENKALVQNKENGNTNVFHHKDSIFIENKKSSQRIDHISSIPITFDGQAEFNIQNVLAAVSASVALGLNLKNINQALMTFQPNQNQSSGRMNMIDMGDFKVMIDYGHNPAAVLATGNFIKDLTKGKKIRLAFGVGNRKETDLLKFGSALANFYDSIVLSDPDPRTRKLGQTTGIVRKGLLEAGFDEEKIQIILPENEAILFALKMAKKSDLVILQVDNIQEATQLVLKYKNSLS